MTAFMYLCSTVYLFEPDLYFYIVDVKDIAYVINMDFPLVIEDYVHRIGRTARAEKSGIAISFFSDEDFKLSRDLVNILRDSKQHVPEQLEIIARHTSGSSKRPRQTSGSNKRPYKQSQSKFHCICTATSQNSHH